MKAHRFTRSLTNRTLGGVCGGLGEYLDVDPWWFRILFIALGGLTAGTGILLYLALWFVLSPQRLRDVPVFMAQERYSRRPEIVILIGAAAVGMGLVILARNLGVLSGGDGDAFLPLMVIVFGAMLLFKQLWRMA